MVTLRLLVRLRCHGETFIDEGRSNEPGCSLDLGILAFRSGPRLAGVGFNKILCIRDNLIQLGISNLYLRYTGEISNLFLRDVWQGYVASVAVTIISKLKLSMPVIEESTCKVKVTLRISPGLITWPA